ncbi:MAG: UDP-N-acetylmuramate--L-alanine ligase [Anaerolineales bacterium]
MKHIHLIGIGGSGMSAIARFLLEKGYVVSGSDRVDGPYLDDLRKLNAVIYMGHVSKNITNADLVVRSSAIPDSNPEIVAALQKGIEVVKRADFLGSLMKGKNGIAVAGTHGKTTTTAMLAWVLTALDLDPSYIVGGILNNTGVNAHYGKGNEFVIEADEYDHMFLGLDPKIEVITNVEHDHPDCYPTSDSFIEAFKSFVGILDENGYLVLNGNDDNSMVLAETAAERGTPISTYGIPAQNSKTMNVYASELRRNDSGGFSYSATVNGIEMDVQLQVPGRHNVVNSLAVLNVIDHLKLPMDDAINALDEFNGTGRRFEVCGQFNGITLINDYAHHPTEIQATLAAARTRYQDRKIWAVWQPHTYSRTQLLMNEFIKSFVDADHVIITEVFAAREPKQDFSISQAVSKMDHPDARFISGIKETADTLIEELKPGDVLLVLSAGDADQINVLIMNHYKDLR